MICKIWNLHDPPLRQMLNSLSKSKYERSNSSSLITQQVPSIIFNTEYTELGHKKYTELKYHTVSIQSCGLQQIEKVLVGVWSAYLLLWPIIFRHKIMWSQVKYNNWIREENVFLFTAFL